MASLCHEWHSQQEKNINIVQRAPEIILAQQAWSELNDVRETRDESLTMMCHAIGVSMCH